MVPKSLMFFLFTLFLLSFISLAEEKLNHTSTNIKEYISDDLAKDVIFFKKYIKSEKFQITQCREVLPVIYSEIFTRSPQSFNWNILLEKTNETINNLFLTRTELRKKLSYFISNSDIDLNATSEDKCVSSMRAAFRAIRFIEEYLGQVYLRKNPEEMEKHPEYLSGDLPFYKTTNKEGSVFTPTKPNFGFQSGDIIITRGNAYASAAIARMSEEEGQFSHNTLVYVDEETLVAYTIEAHIEKGVDVRPFLTGHFKDNNMRAMVLRYKGDPNIAHQAAKYMFNHASNRKDLIPYDFHFDDNDDNELNCTEVVSSAYKNGSDALGFKMREVPLFKSKLSNKIPRVMRALEVQKTFAYMPHDLEVDPRFEVIGEWTNFKSLNSSRYKDAVLTTMFNWMDKDKLNYDLKTTIKGFFAGTLFWFLRKVPGPNVWLGLEKEFPTNMPRSTIKLIPSIDKVAKTLENHLEELDNNYLSFRNDNYLVMTTPELYMALEEFRVKDYKNWKKCSLKTVFHNFFHPANDPNSECSPGRQNR